jgi:hypothetical protein
VGGAPSKKQRSLPSTLQVFVNLPTGTTINFEAPGNNTVNSLKSAIMHSEGYPEYQQRLPLNEMEMTSKTRLAAYDFKIGTVLRLVCGMQIFVRTPSRTMVLEVDGSDLIEDVKSITLCQEGILIQGCQLMHNRVILKDGTTLVNNHIGRLALLYLTTSNSMPSFTSASLSMPRPLASARGVLNKEPRLSLSDLQIFVNLPTGRTITLEVTTDSTVDSVKKMIATKERYPLFSQRVLLNGTDLMDTSTLSTHEIKPGTVLRLVCGMQIFVTTPCLTLILEVVGGDLIEDVTRLILDRVRIASDARQLVYNGITLMDSTTLADNNIGGLETLFMM